MNYLFSLAVFHIVGSSFGEITSKVLKKSKVTNLSGTIIDASLRRKNSLQACSLACFHHDTCQGVLFSADKQSGKTCKLIMSESGTMNPSDLSGYAQYLSAICCWFPGGRYAPPINWNHGCPTAYFPLDSSSEGTPYGNDVSVLDFSQPGIVGNGLSFSNPTGNLKASFILQGTFTSPDFCFTQPDTCPEGFVMAFWMNIPGQHGGSSNQAILNTKATSTGHGFRMYWRNGVGFLVELLRADGVEEVLEAEIADYPAGNSFGIWYHYAILYQFDGNDPSNTFDLYLDGTLLNGLHKTASSGSVTLSNPGTVVLANTCVHK